MATLPPWQPLLVMLFNCNLQFDEAVKEVSEEILLDEHIIEPVVDDLLIDIAVDSLDYFDERLKLYECKEVQSQT